jgi:hypothetical protein
MKQIVLRFFPFFVLIFTSPLVSATIYYDFIEAGTGSNLGSIGFSSDVASHDSAWSSTDPTKIEFIRVDFGELEIPYSGSSGVFELGVDFSVSDIGGGFTVTSNNGSGLDAGYVFASTAPLEMRPGVDEFNIGFSSVLDEDSFSLESFYPIRYGNWLAGSGPVLAAPEPPLAVLFGTSALLLGFFTKKPG